MVDHIVCESHESPQSCENFEKFPYFIKLEMHATFLVINGSLSIFFISGQ